MKFKVTEKVDFSECPFCRQRIRSFANIQGDLIVLDEYGRLHLLHCGFLNDIVNLFHRRIRESSTAYDEQILELGGK
jgi:hypothetical protein